MAIIVIGGSSKGVGKTALICGVIAALREYRWTAVKMSTHDHGKPERIWEETEPAVGRGTDTARYLAAGAERALLATPIPREGSEKPDYAHLLDELWATVGQGANVVFESNRILEYLKPDVCLLIHGCMDRTTRKPSFNLVARRADAMVECADADLMLQHESFSRPIFQLAALERISPEMQGWLRKRLTRA